MPVDYASRVLLKIAPVDKSKSKCLSYALMLANSLIHQTGKGVFAFLPIGQRILDKLTNLIEDELRQVGAQKCSLPAIGFEDIWSKSGRWDLYGSGLFRFEDRLKNKACLQPTCEEMIANIASQFGVFKTGSLPVMLFQTTDKFRDEMNPRFGLLRGRQFLMNDLYSFDSDEKCAAETYQRISEVYRRILFDRLNLPEIMIVEANADEMGGELSHEYHLPNQSAEDRLLNCHQCKTAFQSNTINGDKCPKCQQKTEPVITVEIAHTFQLGRHYSSLFDATNASGDPYFMCCFGIGLSRLIAASIDVSTCSEKAMRIPPAISPYKLAVVLPKTDEDHPSMRFSRDLIGQIDSLPNLTSDILVDDRLSKSVGRRLGELNQLGIPNIVVIPAKKSAKPHDLIEMELFRTRPKHDTLELSGLFSHQAMFDILRRG